MQCRQSPNAKQDIRVCGVLHRKYCCESPSGFPILHMMRSLMGCAWYHISICASGNHKCLEEVSEEMWDLIIYFPVDIPNCHLPNTLT